MRDLGEQAEYNEANTDKVTAVSASSPVPAKC